MLIGYARTSTFEQTAGLDAQLRDLQTAGCEKIYSEHVSSVAQRFELDSAIEFARMGDVFIVTKIDRLARSMKDLITILDTLSQKQVSVRILNLGLDTETPTEKLILNVLGCVAQFEREMMLERQREGIEKAKRTGKYKGRKPISDSVRAEISKLNIEGTTKSAIARLLGVGEATVYRVLAEEKVRVTSKTA